MNNSAGKKIFFALTVVIAMSFFIKTIGVRDQSIEETEGELLVEINGTEGAVNDGNRAPFLVTNNFSGGNSNIEISHKNEDDFFVKDKDIPISEQLQIISDRFNWTEAQYIRNSGLWSRGCKRTEPLITNSLTPSDLIAVDFSVHGMKNLLLSNQMESSY